MKLTILNKPLDFFSFSQSTTIIKIRLNLIKPHVKDQKCLLIKDDAVTPQELVKISNQEIVLIVLDGTWREAKKMYSWSPPLQKLPKMRLDVDIKSQYVVKTQPNDKVGDIPSS